MKTTSVIVLAFACLLAGCYQRVTRDDIARAAYMCRGAEKVEYVDSVFGGLEKVKCVGYKEQVLSSDLDYSAKETP